MAVPGADWRNFIDANPTDGAGSTTPDWQDADDPILATDCDGPTGGVERRTAGGTVRRQHGQTRRSATRRFRRHHRRDRPRTSSHRGFHGAERRRGAVRTELKPKIEFGRRLRRKRHLSALFGTRFERSTIGDRRTIHRTIRLTIRDQQVIRIESHSRGAAPVDGPRIPTVITK